MKLFTHGILPKTRMLNCLWAITFMFLLSANAGAQTFTHPGIPLSGSDLSTLKAHVQAGPGNRLTISWQQMVSLN
jgi:hypothetical protein